MTFEKTGREEERKSCYSFFVQMFTPQTRMRTDLESDLRLGKVHLNRPSSTNHCPTQNSSSAQDTGSHSYLIYMVAERQC